MKPDQSGKEEGTKTNRFHSICGTNIILSNDKTVAYRKASFAHGLTFTEDPIQPEEVFLLEIGKTESGWSGHMRMGLSEVNPVTFYSDGRPLPAYALPDLTAIGQNTPLFGNSWIFPVANLVSHLPPDEIEKREEFSNEHYIKTKRGTIRRSVLRSHNQNANGRYGNDKLPTDTGSRIGIVYLPVNETDAAVYFLINGVEFGPCLLDLPYGTKDLRVVVDVYGTTKEVRIIELYGVKSLQSLCLDAIMSNIAKSDVDKLPLPVKLKEFLINGC